MLNQDNLRQTERELLNMKFTSVTEYKILNFWRENEPKLVETLLTKGRLRRTLIQRANDLLDMQIALEKTEGVDPSLSRMEAWNRVMRISEDEMEEAEAWGMTLEEYRNRPSA